MRLARRTPANPEPPKTPSQIRCAVYTRKSTEEGLAQEFNSLDAQREACEAYILSQRHEGWVALSNRYDDGGFTGGNMERPALQRLLADIDRGSVDCVVVYKVDRLSRSLLDFARIMGAFDKQGISFVSVTQQFNTTVSLGRLTLNILLSFAQFEREIIAERTRDKMSAARKKGKWVGGTPVLGYDIDPHGGTLLANQEEAQRIEAIFNLYLERRSLISVVGELNDRGWTTKQWTTRDGRQRRGVPFTKATLFRMLTNVLYSGRVNHKGTIYEGEHAAIVDPAVWNRVDQLLRHNGKTGGKDARNKHNALLRGLLYCEPCGKAMLHTFAAKQTRRYRYYICLTAQQQGWKACPTKSVAANAIEESVVQQIRTLGADRCLAAAAFQKARGQNQARLAELQTDFQGVQRGARKDNQELARLSAGAGPSRLDRMAELQERIRQADGRLEELADEIKELESDHIDEADFRAGLSAFDPVWNDMTTVEQTRLLSILVKRISLNGKTGRVAVEFRSEGLRQLCHKERV
jgi:site-specific DNA recombinase